MGGKSTKVSPSSKVDEEQHSMARLPTATDSLDNSQTFVSSYGRQESSNNSSARGGGRGGGGTSRPDSQRSKRPPSQMSRYSGKVGLNQGHQSRSGSRSYGKSDMRLKDSFQPTRVNQFTATDLANSYRSNFTKSRKQQSIPDPNPSCEHSSFDGDISYLMKVNRGGDEPSVPTILCPSCNSQYSNIVHVPYLLLCGHSFCSQCIEHALRRDPHSLKCGICFIATPVEPQSRAEDFIKNEAILNFIDSKEFASVIGTFHLDRCAECERKPAVMYCSECSASYCESCNQQQHTGSKVRARHKPVPINLKPRQQPTCKKHHGQSCVLYCETERQPMCVLCKFYGEHKFHNYQLLNNSATAYRSMLSMKLAEVDKMEERLSDVAQVHSDMKSEIRNKAKESQEKLERHFADTRKEILAALEHREATLLYLLDRQVEIREAILEEQRMELASARSRSIATKEEVTKLLELNPISALLARKHVDGALDGTLKQTTSFPSVGEESDADMQLLPVGLRPKQELTSKLQQVLHQHGIVLQLPERLNIVEVRIHSNSISIRWEPPHDQNMEVTADRTRTFSLHCFGDVPFKFKKDKIQNFNRRFLSIHSNSPGPSHDSGFQEGASETASQTSDVRLPILPASLRTNSNHNVSLVTVQTPEMMPGSRNLLEEIDSTTATLKPKSVKLAQSTVAARASGALLKLPALLTKTSEEEEELCNQQRSTSSSDSEQDDSNLSEDKPKPCHLLPPSVTVEVSSQTSSGSSTSTLIDGASPNSYMGTNIGLCHKGYAFEEIYAGPDSQFSYSGIIVGATYYFRVRCYNAIGEGPWSDTYKCKVPPTP